MPGRVARQVMEAFEASGLDARYLDIAIRAANGDDWAYELLSDAMSVRELRVRGLESYETVARRRGLATRADEIDNRQGE